MEVKATRRGIVLLLACAILGLVAFSGPASAGPLSNKLICAATGNVEPSIPDDTTADTVTWAVHGGGLCTGDSLGPYVARVEGTGVSVDLGLCDDLVVKDLAIDVQIGLISLSNPLHNTTISQQWFAPITLFPIATPYFVRNTAGTLSGAGSIFTRFGGKCPPAGIGVANMAWAFLKG